VAANITDTMAQAAARHSARARVRRGAGPPARIRRMRCGRALPGIAIPTALTRLPDCATNRAKSNRYAE
jgi:hypothetical protein